MGSDFASRAIDNLRRLFCSDRRKEVERLTDDRIFETNGFTLYKSHLLPQFCLGYSTCTSQQIHYAQVRVGLRWSYLTEEEEDYWATQTKKLAKGSVLPLEPSTWRNFIMGAYRALIMSLMRYPELELDTTESVNE
ncbi:hypothetical protein CERZMDRAFT_97203 [Cercospora zeae-maydis SCOH1-5]|uniref:Uncharacterized protein n=1 Tax=Cercospora zeae-maydis SCOH1-5 TaxID=717836 RepID=A0A6A6FHJ0_9PEZI|nr:hypothetical protein CERZMDRAFT_97203 [Cercospora zeae-maydis SCOH1-5]